LAQVTSVNSNSTKPPPQGTVVLCRMFSVLCVAAFASTSAHAHSKGLLAPGATAGSGVVKALHFDRRFLVCNAYPSESPTKVSKNGVAFVGKSSLGFQECEYLSEKILPKDKVDFEIESAGIKGTFEVSELPDADAVLLLVVQKRDAHSALMAFQSFAFPMNGNKDEAHIAVIDASTNLPREHLKIVDSPKDSKKAASQEELMFNRIYALDSGVYKVSMDGIKTEILELDSKQDYVLLRTGESPEQQALVAFPHSDIPHSGAFAWSLVPYFATLCTLLVF